MSDKDNNDDLKKAIDESLNDGINENDLQDDELYSDDFDEFKDDDDDESGGGFDSTEYDEDEDEDEEIIDKPKGLSTFAKSLIGLGVTSVLGLGGFAAYTITKTADNGNQNEPIKYDNFDVEFDDGFNDDKNDILDDSESRTESEQENSKDVSNKETDTPIKENEISLLHDAENNSSEIISNKESVLKNDSDHIDNIKEDTSKSLSDTTTNEDNEKKNTNLFDGDKLEIIIDKILEDDLFNEKLESKILDIVKTSNKDSMESLTNLITDKIKDYSLQSDKKISSFISDFTNENKSLTKNQIKIIDNIIDKKLSEINENKRISKSRKAELTKARTRLGGFVVINRSLDGKMSVIKTPTGRINVYYKNERFTAEGVKHTVKSIEDNGYLVLVGNKYFIDETEGKVKRKKVQKKKIKKIKKTTKKVTKKDTKKEEKSTTSQKVNPENISSDHYRAEAKTGKKVAIGYSFNGNFSKGYIVRDKSGNWLSLKKGMEIDGLGRILGEDTDGNLLVGDYIILSEKE